MSIPNIITLGRILLVPFIVWAIASNQMEIAFAIFIIAGVSDAVDGFLAKRFNMASELGALLDPLADKALLVSIYVALGIWGAVPRWIVILVVSRDIMIVGAVIVSWLFGKPIPMKPLMVSKLNTVAQVAFAALVLAALGFGFKFDAVRPDPDGFGNGLYFGFGIPLSRGVGAAHEHDRSSLKPHRVAGRCRHGVTAWQAAFNLVSLRLRCRTPRASPATIFSKARPMQPALALVDSWPDWPNRIMLLVGPEGSGKSHLAAIWAEQAGARSTTRPRADRGRGAGRAGDRGAGGRRSEIVRTSTSARCFI